MSSLSEESQCSMNTLYSMTVQTSEYSTDHFKTKPKKRKQRPKVIVKRTGILQRIFLNRNQKRSQYYVTEGGHVNESNQRDITKESTPFKYPFDIDLFAYKDKLRNDQKQERLRRMKLPCSEKPSVRTQQNDDILKRTYVPEVENIVQTITDIDPEWFSLVEGRPILLKESRTTYVQDLRKCLLMKLQIALKEDEITLMEDNYQRELQAIKQLNEKFRLCVSDFEDMLSKDHIESMRLLNIAESMLKETARKDEKYKDLSKELGILKVKVYVLEERWRNLKIYQKFLYQISPMSWRREHDYIHRDTNGGLINDWQAIFDKYRLNETDSIASLNSLIEIFLDDINTQEDPLLYFTDPKQVINVFHELETHNLNSLLHSEELATPLENMTITLEENIEIMEKDDANMREAIAELEANIIWYEDLSNLLEAYTRATIQSSFQSLVAGDETISLFINVEDIYEKIIAPNDANLGIHDMMQAIEGKYEKYMLKLDTISLDAVKSAETEAYAEEFRLMSQAKDAARKVALIDVLTSKLKRVLEPPTYRTTRELKPRSPVRSRGRSESRSEKDRKRSGRKMKSRRNSDDIQFFTDKCPINEMLESKYMPKKEDK